MELSNKKESNQLNFLNNEINNNVSENCNFLNQSISNSKIKNQIKNIENILIITDDLHLSFGTLRLRGKGSAAGHNGLRDVESELNTPNYARLRFGIGQEKKLFDQKKFVLDHWNKDEQEQIKKKIELCTQIVINFGLEGLNSSMNKFNGK